MSDDTARWVATLSDGSTVTEHAGDFKLVPGERRPWVRLNEFCAKNGLHLTSLRLNFKGRTVHLPRLGFDKFDYGDKSRAPLFYSLCYHLEGDMQMDSQELLKQTTFIELSAHYDDLVVSYIQDVTDGKNSWVVVTDDRRAMAESPRRRD
jgi:hypothetical protein